MKIIHWRLLIPIIVVSFLAACSNSEATQTAGKDEVSLILGAYTTPREAYGEIIPLFQQYWLEQTGQQVVFEESYLGSGAQSRAVVEGFEADIVALSLEADVNRIQEAGLISHDWKANTYKGIVSTSVVSFAVRAGNPLGIDDWDDLAQVGLEILTPNPQTSGGAMWNMLALYGAALRGHIAGVPGDDPANALNFMVLVLSNVSVMDKAARDSMINFEMGIGDVAITYENEVLVGQQAGQDYDLVIPRSTILIENPAAVVDTYVDKHGTREVAEAFVNFLFTPQVQEIYTQYGLRSVDPEVAANAASRYPAVEDLFTIEFFGGWPQATNDIFGEDGIYTQAILKVQGVNQ